MLSSVGRAFPSHGKGQEFEPPSVHHIESNGLIQCNYCIKPFLLQKLGGRTSISYIYHHNI